VETGSKMDEVIFEEFKGTGNMELKLDRSLADRRIFPAIDPVASGTRKEDLLLDPQEAPLIWAVRRILANTSSTERAMDMLIKSLKQTDTNQEFLCARPRRPSTARPTAPSSSDRPLASAARSSAGGGAASKRKGEGGSRSWRCPGQPLSTDAVF
jgi:rho: transcription termination factor Rho